MWVEPTYFLKSLKRKIWMLICIPSVVCIALYLATQDLPKKYKSIAQISTGLPVNIVGSNNNKGDHQQKTNFLNHVEAMKTGFIGSMVSYNLLLHDWTEAVPFRDNDQKWVSEKARTLAKERLEEKLISFETLSPYDDLENKLLDLLKRKDYDVSSWIDDGRLVIERIGDTNFIKVEFLSENPFLSAFVVNTMSTEYIRYNNSLNNGNGDSLQFFSDLVEGKKKELDSITEQLNHARSSTQGVDNENTGKMAQLSAYEAKLTEAKERASVLKESLQKAKSKVSNFTSLEDKADDVDPRSSPKVAELQGKLDELLKIYNENGSKNENLKSTINNLKSQLQTELARLSLKSEVQSENEKELEKLTNEERKINSQYKQAELNLLSIRTRINKLRNELSVKPTHSFITSLEYELDKISGQYTTAIEKLDKEKKNKSRIVNGGLKLMVMGQPNAESESIDSLTLVGIALPVSLVVAIIIILISTYVRTPHRPITPTFVVTRK